MENCAQTGTVRLRPHVIDTGIKMCMCATWWIAGRPWLRLPRGCTMRRMPALNWTREHQREAARADLDTYAPSSGQARIVRRADDLRLATAISKHDHASPLDREAAQEALEWLRVNLGACCYPSVHRRLYVVAKRLGVRVADTVVGHPGDAAPAWARDRRLLPKAPPGRRA